MMPRPLTLSSLPILLLAVVALSGCEAADLPPLRDTTPRDTTRPDTRPETGEDTTPLGGAGSHCEPGAEEPTCAEGLTCDNRIRRCVECLIFEQRCSDAGERQTCAVASIAPDGAMRDGVFTPDPCASGQACVPQGLTAARCEEVVCEPNFSTCVSGGVRRACNSFGTNELEETCGPGRACYSGECEFVRHNMVLIFDTSGSMHDYADPQYRGSPLQCQQNGTPCMEPFPECDNANPLTLLNLSKRVFTDVISDIISGYSQFALTRFPQRAAATNIANCWLGWYLPLANQRITGDDDSTDTTSGSWFTDNLSDVLLVGFPPRNNRDNLPQLLEWMDGVERLGPTERTCTNNADCGTGRCGTVNNEKRCFEHTNHELRAGGETPLGKSIFYAGEYVRRFVRVDGKPCTTDGNCGSAGYVCRNDVCVDPYRECKDDFIILFTDGFETQFRNETDFFNPVVQAKRLAYGLNCSEASDCRGGASCDDGVCVGPGQQRGQLPHYEAEVPSLSNPWGVPVSIRTTVITLNERPEANERIAMAGGGENLEVRGDDPQTFENRLRIATTPNFKCTPEELDEIVDPDEIP